MSSEATSEEALFVKDSSELLSIEPIVTLKGIHEKAMTDVTVSRGSRWFETVILTVSLDAHCKVPQFFVCLTVSSFLNALLDF